MPHLGTRKLRCRKGAAPPSCCPSRREFLGTLATLGTGLLLPEWAIAAKNPAIATGRRIIDVHRHFFPPEFVTVAVDRFRAREREIVSQWTVGKTLADMDKNGVE